MGRSTVAYYTLEVKPRRHKNPLHQRSVNDVEKGIGVLEYFNNFLKFQKQSGFLKDEYHKRIVGIKDYKCVGKTVLVTAVSGSFDDEATLINILTGVDEGSIDKNHAAVRECNLLLACPKGTGIAEVAIEFREDADAFFLIKTFMKQLRTLFPDCNAPVKPIVEKDAWLKEGKLEKLSFPLQGVDNQVEVATGIESDDQRETINARLELTIRPGGDTQSFPDNIWTVIRGALKGAAFLTLPAIDDIQDKEVKVLNTKATVRGKNGKHTKTFLIGNHKTPSVREMLTDYGQPYLSPVKFKRQAAEIMYQHYKDAGITIRSDWDEMSWAEKTLPVDPDWSENVWPAKNERTNGDQVEAA